MKINIKLLIIILLSIFSAGYVIITSRKIDNLKREILIEKAKNNRIIDSLINENKIMELNRENIHLKMELEKFEKIGFGFYKKYEDRWNYD